MSIVKVRYWSGSCAVVIPSLFIEALGIDRGAFFQVIALESGFLYMPLSQELKERFKMLFADSSGQKMPGEGIE